MKTELLRTIRLRETGQSAVQTNGDECNKCVSESTVRAHRADRTHRADRLLYTNSEHQNEKCISLNWKWLADGPHPRGVPSAVQTLLPTRTNIGSVQVLRLVDCPPRRAGPSALHFLAPLRKHKFLSKLLKRWRTVRPLGLDCPHSQLFLNNN